MTQNKTKIVLEGNKIDLSLSNLDAVPIKEILACPKALALDLSCNQITSLPSEFSSLVQLVELDLSKNLLRTLPDSFGQLIRLQHIDLSNNRLSNLPISFAQLNNLKYLDLKANPLDDKLKLVAGFCLDEEECKSCARKVVAHFKNIKATLDKQKQKEELKKQEAERVLKAKEEKELQAMRMNKKLEKEKKRLETEQQRLQQHWTQEYPNDTISELKDKVIPGKKPFKFSPRTLVLIIFAMAFIYALFYFLWLAGVGPSSFMTSDL